MGSASEGCVKGLRWRRADVRLVQHSGASARRQRSKKDGRSGCMGRSRGGLTTKIYAVVVAEGLPIALKLTEGQAHDGRSAEDMLGTVQVGDVLLADRAYDSDALRQNLAEHGA